MSLRDQMAADAKNVFANPAQFGETIIYDRDGGGEKSVNAVITRAELDTFGQERDRTTQRRAEVMISRDDVTTAPDKGKTKVRFNKIADDNTTAVDWIIVKIVNKDDPGLWRLEVIAGR